jgi:hypothetical protein
MAADKQCRMTLKNGKRCRYKAKDGGLCGHHRQSLTSRKKTIEKLILAGKVAAALTALINLVEMLVPLYPQIESAIEPLFRGWLFRVSKPGRVDLQYDLKMFTQMKSRENYSGVQRYALHVFAEMHRKFNL